MEWLLPHITRINNFCSTLEHGQKSYIHLSRGLPRGDHQKDPQSGVEERSPPSFVRMDENQTKDSGIEHLEDDHHAKRKEFEDDEIEAEYPPNNNIDFQGQIKRYNEIMKAKSNKFPVSVIVSDRTNSTTSSAPSPTSSITDNSDWYRQGVNEDREGRGKGRGKSYSYKPAPMVKKSERRFISAEKKDSTYWERRKRNNAAARKSRESRREKEIEVNRKCDMLKQENDGMRFTIMNLQERNIQLESTMKLYKEILIKNNLL